MVKFFVFMLIPLQLLAISPNFEVNVDENFTQITHFTLGYYHDVNHSKTAKDIVTSTSLQPLSNAFSLGIQSGVHYFAFRLDNHANHPLQLYAKLSERTYEYANLYLLDSHLHIVHSSLSGQKIAHKQREIDNPSFVFSLPLLEKSSYFVVISIESTAGTFGRITLLNRENLHKQTLKELSIFLLFNGAILAITLYALLMSVLLKELLYLYYGGYVLLFGILSFAFSGNMTYLLHIEQSTHFFAIVPAISALFILFSKSLLSIKKTLPRLNTLLNSIFALLVASTLLIAFDPSISPTLITLLLIVSFTLLIVVGIYLAYRGDIIARIYLIAVVIYLSSIIFFMLVSAAIIPLYEEYYKYIPLIGSLSEFLLIVVALALKLNLIKKERLELSERLSKTLKEYSITLEKEVKTRTSELNDAMHELAVMHKELEHRVKNNFQTILSFLWLQRHKSTSEEVEIALDTVKLRLEAIIHAHSLLQNDQNLLEIELHTYVQNLLYNIEQTHNNPNISHIYRYEPLTISFNDAVTLGLIINELISNIYKHAFSAKGGKIYVKLATYRDDYLRIIIKDTGVGILEKSTVGSGLTIIQELLKKLPQSSMRTKTIHGYCIVVTCKRVKQ